MACLGTTRPTDYLEIVIIVFCLRFIQYMNRNNAPTGVRTWNHSIKEWRFTPLCHSSCTRCWIVGILIPLLSSPLLSYLIFRESWLDIVAHKYKNTRPKNVTEIHYSWFLSKLEIVSERRIDKIPFGVPNESAGNVVYPLVTLNSKPRRLRAAYPSRNWVEVHLDRRTERLVSIFFVEPRTWKWKGDGFEHVIYCAM